jgi:hypothetical protein
MGVTLAMPESVMELLEFKARCLKEAAPYVRSKMPVELDVKKADRAVLIMGELRDSMRSGEGERVMTLIENDEQFQGLGFSDDGPSDE